MGAKARNFTDVRMAMQRYVDQEILAGVSWTVLRGRDAPTAVFVSNDIGAIAFIEACERLGLGVPDDISVVGFDDIAIAGLQRISLTTIAQSLDAQAERAVRSCPESVIMLKRG